ncbi:RNA-binding protein [Terrilactibacillus sp. S3-3]|nr:RNA-binding protein [Terrilactibacillus sp. S3-3]
MAVYEHFREEERPFIDRILDLKDWTLSRYAAKLTDFLNPREQEIVKALVGQSGDVRAAFWGGFKQAERKRALIFPLYFEPEKDSFEIAAFQVQYPVKFASLSHRDLLGALIGTGIVRSKIGDLLFSDKVVQFVAASEVADYLRLNLTSVGKAPVSSDLISIDELVHNHNVWQEFSGTVNSFRLDAVLSEIYHLSRARAAEYIDHGSAQVNWALVSKRAYDLHVGDVVSLRGYGRSKIIAVEGATKRDKIRFRYGKLR